jgi:hypothetical protein
MNDVFDTFPNLQRCAADVITTAELGRRLATDARCESSTASA